MENSQPDKTKTVLNEVGLMHVATSHSTPTHPISLRKPRLQKTQFQGQKDCPARGQIDGTSTGT